MAKKIKQTPQKITHSAAEPHSSLPEASSSALEGRSGEEGVKRRKKFITRMREFNPSAQLSVAGEESAGGSMVSAR